MLFLFFNQIWDPKLLTKRNPKLIDPQISKHNTSNIYMILQIHNKYNIFIIYYICKIHKLINAFII